MGTFFPPDLVLCGNRFIADVALLRGLRRACGGQGADGVFDGYRRGRGGYGRRTSFLDGKGPSGGQACGFSSDLYLFARALRLNRIADGKWRSGTGICAGCQNGRAARRSNFRMRRSHFYVRRYRFRVRRCRFRVRRCGFRMRRCCPGMRRRRSCVRRYRFGTRRDHFRVRRYDSRSATESLRCAALPFPPAAQRFSGAARSFQGAARPFLQAPRSFSRAALALWSAAEAFRYGPLAPGCGPLPPWYAARSCWKAPRVLWGFVCEIHDPGVRTVRVIHSACRDFPRSCRIVKLTGWFLMGTASHSNSPDCVILRPSWDYGVFMHNPD